MKSEVTALSVVRPLEHRHVLPQVHLVHPPERPQERPAAPSRSLPGCYSAPPAPRPRRRPAPTPCASGDRRVSRARARPAGVRRTTRRSTPPPRPAPPPAPPGPLRPAAARATPAAAAAVAAHHPADRRPVVVPGAVAPGPPSPAAAAGRRGRCAAPLFSPAWYISSASTWASGSGERSAAARAWAWRLCRRASRWRRLAPARGPAGRSTPWANPRRIRTSTRGGIRVRPGRCR